MYRIQVRPVNVHDAADQALIDNPHFVGHSTNPIFRHSTPNHTRIVPATGDVILFDDQESARDFASVLSTNKSHTYTVVLA